MNGGLLRWLGGEKKAELEQFQLWLISAWELLQAKKEAERLSRETPESAGLCLNAAILARAAKKDGERVFSDAENVLRRVNAEQIERWMQRYFALCAEENPSCCGESRTELREALEQAPYERLKWRVLRSFGVLPSEKRAREMTDGDFLYCILQMELDEQEVLDRLCPQCREESEQERCILCGQPMEQVNPGFDAERYEELRHGKLC